MNHLIKFFLNIIFPKICPGCGRLNAEKNLICSLCLEKIPINNGWFCPKCQRRLPTPENSCHPTTGFILAAAAPYAEKSVQETIRIMKYQRLENAVGDLTVIFEKYLGKIGGEMNDWLSSKNLLIPIPLHPTKEKKRGFNQSYLLTQGAGKILINLYPEKKFRIEEKILKRTRNIPSQTECRDYHRREENVKNVFSVSDPNRVRNETIIIIDDVFTSGATMREAVKTLKAAGAKKIMALTVAKA